MRIGVVTGQLIKSHIMDGAGIVDLVRKWRKDGLTYREISEKLQQLFPHRRGFTERSVRRYCKEKGIRKMDEQEIVGAAVEEVYNQCLVTLVAIVTLCQLLTGW